MSTISDSIYARPDGSVEGAERRVSEGGWVSGNDRMVVVLSEMVLADKME